MSKHTPGPWIVKRADTGHTAIYPVNSRERVADIYCPVDVDGSHAANARLIAAAPDMLAALRRILDAPAFAVDDLEDEDRDACDAVRAAIAKAEGGTPWNTK